ncbi:TPA: hypothetical protein QDC44_002003 [Burkholderia cepacia ATCC 25416]|nr:hypothetical protein [Burkholderia cepacia ATCC 25416]
MKKLLAAVLLLVAWGWVVESHAADVDNEALWKLLHPDQPVPARIETSSQIWCVSLHNDKGAQKTIQLEMYQQSLLWADPEWDVQAYTKDGFTTESFKRGRCAEKVEIVRQYLGAQQGDVPGTCSCLAIKRDDSGKTLDTINFDRRPMCGERACNEWCQWKHSSYHPKNYTGLRTTYKWGGGKCVP